MREDLVRCDASGFQLPLGVEAIGLPRPTEGYTLEYNAAEQEDADSYSFHVVASHPQVRAIIHPALTLLPADPVVEVFSGEDAEMPLGETGATEVALVDPPADTSEGTPPPPSE